MTWRITDQSQNKRPSPLAQQFETHFSSRSETAQLVMRLTVFNAACQGVVPDDSKNVAPTKISKLLLCCAQGTYGGHGDAVDCDALSPPPTIDSPYGESRLNPTVSRCGQAEQLARCGSVAHGTGRRAQELPEGERPRRGPNSGRSANGTPAQLRPGFLLCGRNLDLLARRERVITGRAQTRPFQGPLCLRLSNAIRNCPLCVIALLSLMVSLKVGSPMATTAQLICPSLLVWAARFAAGRSRLIAISARNGRSASASARKIAGGSCPSVLLSRRIESGSQSFRFNRSIFLLANAGSLSGYLPVFMSGNSSSLCGLDPGRSRCQHIL
jgi:hypothetical protein